MSMNKVDSIQILSYRGSKFVVYADGSYGNPNNFFSCENIHGRVIGSPVFDSVEDAVKWSQEQDGFPVKGHKYGSDCACLGRMVVDFPVKDGKMAMVNNWKAVVMESLKKQAYESQRRDS